MSRAVSGRPRMHSSTRVMMAAGKAIRKFRRNLSFISTFWPRAAAMVVSEMKDRLSPNIAPPTTAPSSMTMFKLAFSATPTAMGVMAAMVPMEGPQAVDISMAMINTPPSRNWVGTRDNPRFTTASRPPMTLATEENAPDREKIISMIKTPSSPAPFAKTENRSLIFPFAKAKVRATAHKHAVTMGNPHRNKAIITMNGIRVQPFTFLVSMHFSFFLSHTLGIAGKC